MTAHQQKITLGEMRSNGGPRLLIVYCADFKCSHSVIQDAKPWSEDVRLSDLDLVAPRPARNVAARRRCQAAV
jgi:hypothetical protein